MKTNTERLFLHLLELGKVGEKENGGITRLSFTEEEKQAKELVKAYMKEAGLLVREDSVGNLIGRKEGTNANAPVILIGSHLDSVPDGGKFDGSLGVLAGIEVLHSLMEQKIKTTHPIEVIAFKDEEGARFGCGMIGSRAITGKLGLELLKQVDASGISMAEAMKETGLDIAEIVDLARNPECVKAYIELHIEQGKVLEDHHLPIGIVSGIAGPVWMNFTLIGEAGHAGATPMNVRRDPIVAGAKIITYINNRTKRYPDAVATIGQINILPNAINVIPSQMEFSLDLRDVHEATRDKIEILIRSYAEKICDRHGIKLDINILQRVSPSLCNSEICNIIEEGCKEAGEEPFYLVSGAGHDGMQFKDFCPVGMIFVRSRNGISHRADEWSSQEDCGAGTEVLYNTILKLDKYT
ncbi:Zn-dependent hydrolase [Clostridium aminobutyricum]|uniref:Zn-dependent hydrolase n=1 Tax=Clostridium aminobutyricum TaxID=33953 RepID=A0A939DA30_CLOAM|nr:Zn-dependent hydrolase [Clostridium aminobutyricum]MBN7774001.1 Zn-dependent hydrolase [Clostridium aminobutyricum]